MYFIKCIKNADGIFAQFASSSIFWNETTSIAFENIWIVFELTSIVLFTNNSFHRFPYTYFCLFSDENQNSMAITQW